MSVRVRIAPAPSGSLHIGNVRTALYNWLFARHTDGTFILRVEDTDPSRSFPEHYETIKEDLRWLGLDWDEGPGVDGPHAPYLQTERLALYADAAKRLLEAGAVYRCYCTPEELRARRGEAIAAKRRWRYDRRCLQLAENELKSFESENRLWALRLRVPAEGETKFDDVVTGEVVFRHEDLDDIILVRSDGRPLYNLAATVDDGLMEITHVIRGLDLQSSTPYQIILHGVLGNAVPTYAHVPLVYGPGGQPLSKRYGGDSVATFRSLGYLPEAMMNYLALLGWGTADQTILDKDELISKFELEKVHASPANIDPDKLDWMNGEYIRMLDDEDLTERMIPWLVRDGLVSDPPDGEQREKIVIATPLVKTRIKRLDGVAGLIRSWFADVEPDPSDFERVMRQPWVPELLDKAVNSLSSLASWDQDSIEGALRSVVDELSLKLRVASRPLYVAISGNAASAPLFDTMAVVGRDKSVERLKRARALVG